tara:strand:- start:222 stop:1907 length:1686 start_codon:yes stop_codon:yes gene_type:complete
MCLSFDYAAAFQAAHDFAATEAAHAGEAALKAAHDNVDCSKIQITMLNHKDGSRSTLCYMPLSSPTAVMAMYPCPRVCLGESAEFLIPCDTIPCNAANLEAWYEPGKFVPIPDVIEVPVYRSLSGGGGGGGAAEPAVPVVELPPSKCIKNLDGSCTFVLKAAEFVKSDAEIEAAIESKEYPDKPTYLVTLGKACFKSLTEGMDANGVNKSKIFAMSEDDETEVDPCAMMNFLNELYPNLRANNDMLVCIPGPDADGNLKMEAAFSFAFHYPDARYWQPMPMPGLVHNIDHGTASSEQAVEGDYYITSNANFPMTIDNDETGVTTNVGLCHASEFLPYSQIPAAYRHLDRSDYHYRSLHAGPRKDYDAWISGCQALQRKVQTAYWDSISTVCGKMGLPDFDKENFQSTNLVGRFLAKNATSVMCGKDSREYEGGNVLHRMKAAREATAAAAEARANKRQALSPVAGVGGMEVEAAPVATGPPALAHTTSLETFVHNERALHLLNAVPAGFVEMALALCRGMNPDYVDMSGVGFGRFKINNMTEAHINDLMRFAEHLPKPTVA